MSVVIHRSVRLTIVKKRISHVFVPINVKECFKFKVVVKWIIQLPLEYYTDNQSKSKHTFELRNQNKRII